MLPELMLAVNIIMLQPLVALLFAAQGPAATLSCLNAAAAVSGLGFLISASRGLVRPATA